jgi:broad specificity phosphatase PhoE
VFLARHGETEWNRIRRRQGQLNSPLTRGALAHAKARRVRRTTPPQVVAAQSPFSLSAEKPDLRYSRSWVGSIL